MKVLIVQNEADTARYVRKGLMEQGYVVDVAHDGIDGIHLATTGSYDLVVLDVLLPEVDGWTVLKSIREKTQMPVIFLTACDAVDDRVKGLELGADDYLVKPFAFSELLARIRVLLRRPAAKTEQRIRVADLEVDVLRRRVSRGGRKLDLTNKEFAVLEYMLRHPGQAVSRTLLTEHVWNMNYDSNTNVVDVAVRRLRAKVDDAHQAKLIHTVRGVGYAVGGQGA